MTNFKKALKRNISKSGDPGNKRVAKSEFYKELLWLKDLYTPRETYTNVVSLLSPPISPLDNSLSVNTNNDDNLENNFGEKLPTPKIITSPKYVTPTVSKNSTAGKKKRGTSDEVDALLIKALSEDTSAKNKSDNKYEMHDPEYAFCMSIIPELKQLSSKNRKKAKIAIMQTLTDLDESDE